MEKEQLDFVLVPLGLLVFLMYHIWLVYSIVHNPLRTVIGLNAESRHQWVLAIMSVSSSLHHHFFFSLFRFMKSLCFEYVLAYKILITKGSPHNNTGGSLIVFGKVVSFG